VNLLSLAFCLGISPSGVPTLAQLGPFPVLSDIFGGRNALLDPLNYYCIRDWPDRALRLAGFAGVHGQGGAWGCSPILAT
jgi:hypothetical protein